MTRDDVRTGRQRISRRRLLRAGAVLAATGLAGCGYRPGPGDRKWSQSIPYGVSDDTTLLAGDSRLFLVDAKDRWFDPEVDAWRNGARVTGYDADEGAETWYQEVARYCPVSAASNEAVYLGLAPLSEAPDSMWDVGGDPAGPPTDPIVRADRAVLALSTDGSEQWVAPLSASPVALAADSSGVYVLTADDTLRAFSRRDGGQRWTFDVGVAGSEATVSAGGEAGPIAVVSSAAASTLTVLTRAGERRWAVDTALGFEPAPIVGTDGIYVYDGPTLHAFDLDTGRERWTERVGRPLGPPLVDDESIYVSAGGSLTALDLQSGEERWSVGSDYHFDPEEGVDVSTAPALGDGRVYVGGDFLYCLDPVDGSVVWRLDVSVEALFPRLVDGTLVVDTAYGELRGYHTA